MIGDSSIVVSKCHVFSIDEVGLLALKIVVPELVILDKDEYMHGWMSKSILYAKVV